MHFVASRRCARGTAGSAPWGRAKRPLWGPLIGAVIFHLFKEGFWTYFLGWQYVALGVLIVVIVVYVPEGLRGWLREKYPERFGEVIDEADRKAQVELK